MVRSDELWLWQRGGPLSLQIAPAVPGHDWAGAGPSAEVTDVLLGSTSTTPTGSWIELSAAASVAGVTTVYKILRADEWAAAQTTERYQGSVDDLRDGFVHLSTGGQVPGTLDRYFSGETGLMLLAVDAESLGGELRWETSTGGNTYPHYYGALPMAAVTEVTPVKPER